MKHLSKRKSLATATLLLLLGSSNPLNAAELLQGGNEDVNVVVDFTPVLQAITETQTIINNFQTDVDTNLTGIETDLTEIKRELNYPPTLPGRTVRGDMDTLLGEIGNPNDPVTTTPATVFSDLNQILQDIGDLNGETVASQFLAILDALGDANGTTVFAQLTTILNNIQQGDTTIINNINHLAQIVFCLGKNTHCIYEGMGHILKLMGHPVDPNCQNPETLFKLLEGLKATDQNLNTEVIKIFQGVNNLINRIGDLRINGQSVTLAATFGDPHFAQPSDQSVFGKLNAILHQLGAVNTPSAAQNWLQQLKSTTDAVQGVSQQVTTVDGKVDHLTVLVGTISQQIKELTEEEAEEGEDQQKKFKSLLGQLTCLHNKLTQYHTTLGTVGGNVTKVDGKVDTLQQEIAQANGQLVVLQEKLENLLQGNHKFHLHAGETKTGDLTLQTLNETLSKVLQGIHVVIGLQGNYKQDTAKIVSIDQRLTEILQKQAESDEKGRLLSTQVLQLQEEVKGFSQTNSLIQQNLSTVAEGTRKLLLQSSDSKTNPLMQTIGTFKNPHYTVTGYLEAMTDALQQVSTNQAVKALSAKMDTLETELRQIKINQESYGAVLSTILGELRSLKK